jgi:hypothetical protein
MKSLNESISFEMVVNLDQIRSMTDIERKTIETQVD